MRTFLCGILAAHFVTTGTANAETLDEATVRITSHGASGVIVASRPGQTLILTAAHPFEGHGASRELLLDVPGRDALPRAAGPIRKFLVRCDYQRDVALIELNVGPFAAVCPLAPVAPRRGAEVWSAGYDQMRWPANYVKTRLVGSDQNVLYTADRPVSGRSGGPLYDPVAGGVVGVVTGYEMVGQGRGVYASWTAIQAVMGRHRGVPGAIGGPAVREERDFGVSGPRLGTYRRSEDWR